MSRPGFIVLVTVACQLATIPVARAEKKKRRSTAAAIARLEAEVERQRRLLAYLVELEQQKWKLIGGMMAGEGAPAPAALAVPAEVEPPELPRAQVAAPATSRRSTPRPPKASEPPKAAPVPISGTVTGRLMLNGKPAKGWVYATDVTATASGTASMAQRDKRFDPSVLVVQKGTRVVFPNMDPIFHNVFSVSATSSFDLGEYRQGDAKSVVMSQAGLVSVFCNMHPQMIGYILVVPGPIHEASGGDGSFSLELPPGRHRIAAWAPGSAPTEKEVVVVEGTVDAGDLALARATSGKHTKKDGTPYGSYSD